jgi:hypothetical protein
MKRILSAALLLQLVFFVPAQAQFQNIESRYLGQIKGKTLLVPTLEQVTRTLLDLQKKPDELERYKSGVENFNNAIKDAVDKYGKFTKTVEYLPQTKVNAILKEGNTKYIVLQYGLREGVYKPLMFSDMYADQEYSSALRKASAAEGFGVFNLLMPVKDKEPEIIYSVFIPVAYPSPGDMIYAIQMISTQVGTMQKSRGYQVSEFNAEIAKNNKSLKDRTLLLDNSQVDPKADVNGLSKSYAYNFKVVDYQEINRAIVEGDTSVAYVQVVPMEMPGNKVTYGKAKTPLMHLVVSAGDSKVLGKSRVTRMDYENLATDVSKKEIDDYVIKEQPEKPQPSKEKAKEQPKQAPKKK